MTKHTIHNHPYMRGSEINFQSSKNEMMGKQYPLLSDTISPGLLSR
ncbi:hypothetical protein SAMN05421677_10317 [Halobacillus aidingensis]|uniref:Uncharacterized protein n=1 Tax=Halobacillus aidingensis TaxID=240303 RepID=A0A1H0H1Q3_HALAD|nr:hypothetical protein SAMN05421677_10317 [Halobacillus aidingensis]